MGEHDGILLDRWESTGDQQAFMELVTRYQGMVFGVCARIVKDQTKAEDLVQECFLKLTKTRPKNVHALGPWLHRIATNTSINQLDSEIRRRNREKKYMEGVGSSQEAAWDDISEIIDEELNTLPIENREIIIAHFFQGLTQVEVARLLEIPRTTVRSRMKSGLDQLHRKLKSRGIVVPTAALIGMMTSSVANTAPPALAAAMGTAVLSGAFNPQKAALSAFSKILAAFAAVLLVAFSLYILTTKSSPSLTEEPNLENAQPPVFAQDIGLDADSPILASAQNEAEVELPIDDRFATAEPQPRELVTETDRIRLQCVDEKGDPVAGATVYVFQIAADVVVTLESLDYEKFPIRKDGPFTSDKKGYIEFSAISSSENATKSRTAYAVMPDRLVGVWHSLEGPLVKTSDTGSTIKMVKSVSVPGHVKVPPGFLFSSVQVDTKSLRPGTGNGPSVYNSFEKTLMFDALTVPVDSQGRFWVRNIPANGSFTIRARGTGLAETQKIVADRTQVDLIELNLKPEGVIEGYVRYEGTRYPVVDHKVFALGRFTQHSATTDVTGRYQIGNLLDGLYTVTVEMKEYPPTEIAAAYKGVNVTTGEIKENIDFVMEAGEIVQGRVIEKSTGVPVAGVYLAVVNPTLGSAFINGSTSDESGYFEMRLPAGESTFLTRHDFPPPRASEFRKNRKVVVSEEQLLELVIVKIESDVAIPVGGKATITGQVFGQNGSAIEGALISVGGQRKGTSGKNGNFNIEIDAPVGFQRQLVVGGREWSAFAGGWISPEKNEIIDIGDVFLTRYDETMSMQLVTDDGEPASGVYYDVEAEDFYRPHQLLQSDSEGMIYLKNLPAAEVEITIRDDRYKKTVWKGLPGQHVEFVVKRREVTSNQ